MKTEITNQFTSQQIEKYNDNAKSQGADNFSDTVDMAIDFAKKGRMGNEYNTALNIVQGAIKNAVDVKINNDSFFDCTEAQTEDCKQYK